MNDDLHKRLKDVGKLIRPPPMPPGTLRRIESRVKRDERNQWLLILVFALVSFLLFIMNHE